MKNITYTERNGIRYPNLALPEQTNKNFGTETSYRKKIAEPTQKK